MAKCKQKLLTYLLYTTFFISSTTVFPSLAHASNSSMQGYAPDAAYTRTGDEPGFFRMAGDLLIARPLLLATTAVGTGLFLASLPFSILGGNVEEAADTLVIDPAWLTFGRCLGCTIFNLNDEEDPATPSYQ